MTATLVRIVDGPGGPLELAWRDGGGVDRGVVLGVRDAVWLARELADGVWRWPGEAVVLVWPDDAAAVLLAVVPPAHALALAEALLRGARLRLGAG